MENSEFQQQIINDLTTNEKYKQYFSKFAPSSVEVFIKDFAFTKQMYTHYAEMFQTEKEQSELGLLPEALQCLAEIQQKKLFDKQCLWRAASIDIEGITNTFYFNYWADYIFMCPFIEPVTESDVDLYMQYLNSTDVAVLNNEFSYQDYDEIKESMSNEETDGYPAWYQFYDTYRGTSMNIKLPNVRGEKEEFYRNLCFQNQKEQQINYGTHIEYNMANQLPYLNLHNEAQLKEFVKLFGTSTELELLENYYSSKNNNSDFLHDAIFTLSQAKEPVSINANKDWREAIIEAAQLFKNKLIARALPLAFEEYQMKLDTGISFYDIIPPIEEDDNASRVNEQILKGKTLNNEFPEIDY